MSEPIQCGDVIKPTKYRCPKCKTEIVCYLPWSVIEFRFAAAAGQQLFSTGPVCPKCVVEFIKANIPVMEVVSEPAASDDGKKCERAASPDDISVGERAIERDDNSAKERV